MVEAKASSTGGETTDFSEGGCHGFWGLGRRGRGCGMTITFDRTHVTAVTIAIVKSGHVSLLRGNSYPILCLDWCFSSFQ